MIAYPGSVFALIRLPPHEIGGGGRDRTDDLKLAKLALSQLSYAPGFDGSPVQLENGGPGKT